MNEFLKKYSAITIAALYLTFAGVSTASADRADIPLHTDETATIDSAGTDDSAHSANPDNGSLSTDDVPGGASTQDQPEQVDSREKCDCPFADVDAFTRLPLMGDLDLDGKITSSDSLQILRASVGSFEGRTDRYRAGDVNGDNMITSADALYILRRSAGYLQTFKDDPQVDVKWLTDGPEYFAQHGDGSPVTGIAVIDGYKCGFDELGRLMTVQAQIDGRLYDFTSSGILPDGWQYTDSGKSYYIDGQRLDGWNSIYGLKYFFKDGVALTGWQNINGVTMFFDDNATAAGG